MNNEQFERVIKALYRIEESVQKSKVRLSWMPFWIAGYLFTIGFNFDEANQIMTTASTLERVFYTIIWFAGWPVFLGHTIAK